MRHLLGIDGRDGSGKSHLAEALVQASHGSALLVRIDDFRCPVNWAESGDESGCYYNSYYDFATLDALLAEFLAGAPSSRAPIFDSVAEAISGDRILRFDGAQRIDVLIVEGVMLRRLGAMHNSSDATGVYIGTSETEARRRILARDVAKGRSSPEVARRIDHRYFPAQRRYHQEHAPQAAAQVVLEHEELARPRLLRCDLAQRPAPVRALLESVLPDPTD